MADPIIQRAFLGGELAPSLGARADLPKYLFGLRTCRNFLVRRHGGVTKRPGTRFIQAVKTPSVCPRLIPFVFEAADASYLIEAGPLYFRFYWHGAPVVVSGVAAYSAGTNYGAGDLVVSGGVNYYSLSDGNLGHTPASSGAFWYPLTGTTYEVPSPYATNDVARLQYTQSADTLVITHPSYQPRELRRLGATKWVLVPITTQPSTSAPTAPAGTPGAAGSLAIKYVVTAAKSETYEESYASTAFTVTGALPTVTAPNALSNAAVAGAVEYYWYSDGGYGNGVYGFVGVAAGLTFNDVGLLPDFSRTPPVPRVLFNAANAYPAVATYQQQRLWFSHSNNDRETVWGSKIGAYHNFSISTPIQDDDAVTFVIAGNLVSPVAFLLGMKNLVILSDTAHYAVLGDDTGAITPSAINAVPQGTIGSDYRVRPVLIGDCALFVQGRGAAIREIAFEQSRDAFGSRDLTILASHLFEGYTIEDLAFAYQPHGIVWAIRSDGTLLGLTYVKEEDVWAWHRHDTGSSGDGFEAVCVIPDTTAGEDVLYLVARRTINGTETRYIERLTSRYVTNLADGLFVDSGLTYSGALATVITGLTHLEGQRVAILGDGVVVSDGQTGTAYTVSGGAVTLPASRAKVQIGLPIRSELQTLDLDVQGSSVRGKRKRVPNVTLLIESSTRGFYAGPDAAHLFLNRPEPFQAAADGLVTEAQEMVIPTTWDDIGRLLIRHDDPLPFAVNGLIPNVEVG